jgi:hypothetical protein
VQAAVPARSVDGRQAAQMAQVVVTGGDNPQPLAIGAS